MEDRDKISFLQELAASHFNDGNLQAALSAWKQVLDVDPGNADALKGIELTQRKLAVSADIARHEASIGEGGGMDADATMVFGGGLPPAPAAADEADRTMMFAPTPPAGGGAGGFDADSTLMFNAPPPPSAPAGGFDAEKTMMFGGAPAAKPAAGGFDAERTMMFNPAAASSAPAPGPFDAEKTMMFGAPAAKPAAGGFDAERTMMFNPAAAAPAPAAGGFDAEKTMMFGGAPATPRPPESDSTIVSPDSFGFAPTPQPPPAADADRTMMSPDSGASSFALPPPPPPPPPPAPAQAKTTPGGKALEDFVMPTGGLGEVSAAPGGGLGELNLPPLPGGGGAAPGAPGGWGFSFELPPPPTTGSPTGKTGSMPVPDLPSLGIPAPPPPPPPKAPKESGKFGEVDPGELAGLEVPTVGIGHATETGDAEAKAREEELKARYANEFGKTPVASETPRPTYVPEKGKNWKVWLGVFGVIAVLLVGAYFAIPYLNPPPPPPPENPELTRKLDPADVTKQIEDFLKEAQGQIDKGEPEAAFKVYGKAKDLMADPRVVALNLPPVPGYAEMQGKIDDEQTYRSAYRKAVQAFCKEDYTRTTLEQFEKLKAQRPNDPEPVKYIERIYYNAGIQQLQQKQPWEAVWYFEQVLQLKPDDKEATERRNFASKFKPGDSLEDAYLSSVDKMGYRRAGCH